MFQTSTAMESWNGDRPTTRIVGDGPVRWHNIPTSHPTDDLRNKWRSYPATVHPNVCTAPTHWAARMACDREHSGSVYV